MAALGLPATGSRRAGHQLPFGRPAFPERPLPCPGRRLLRVHRREAPKSKWLFTAAGASLGTDFFCVAGLVRDDRFTMLTTEPGPDIAPYHDRQIVILPRERWAEWLRPSPETPPLRPLPAGSLAVMQIR